MKSNICPFIYEPWKTVLENLEWELLSDVRLERGSAAEGPAELQYPGERSLLYVVDRPEPSKRLKNDTNV